MTLEITHFSHPHPLKLLEKTDDVIFLDCCDRSYSASSDGEVYSCHSCYYFMHQSCSQIPLEIHHFYHPGHLLKLSARELGSPYAICAACGEDYGGFAYKCSATDCDNLNFNMDVKCALLPDKLKLDDCNIDYVLHLSHGHPLMLCCGGGDDELIKEKRCRGCKKPCLGKTYGCRECDFFLDESCVLLPQEEIDQDQLNSWIRHDLTGDEMIEIESDAEIEIESVKAKHLEITHFSHPHPLDLMEKTDDGIYLNCCGKSYSSSSDDQVYGCDFCDYYIHQSCSQIPLEIHHFYHPGHLLKLSAQGSRSRNTYDCAACGETYGGFAYECSVWNCNIGVWFPNFNMDIKCALLPDKLKLDDCNIDYILHLSHGHPMMLCDESIKEKSCRGCKKPCMEKTYGCPQCDFFLDESCVLLPQELDHPFHPSHPLTLSFLLNHYQCVACGEKCPKNFSYICCGPCKFVLDLKCASLLPTIQFEGHKHRLTLIKSGHLDFPCDLCKKGCGGDSSIVRCVECNYNLHLLCGPLPRTIKDTKCHLDPLKLMDHFVEDEYQADDMYCDVCEELRDPEECVYYCKDCNFVCEFKCVMHEVIASLEGLRGNVKLRSANKINSWIHGTVIRHDLTGDEIIEVESDADIEIENVKAKYLEVKLDPNPQALSAHFEDKKEVHQVMQIFANAGVQFSRLRLSNYASISKYSQAQMSLLVHTKRHSRSDASEEIFMQLAGEVDTEDDDQNFKQFIGKLDSNNYVDDYLCEMFDTSTLSIVMIGELMVIEEFGSILKGLLYKYDDFTSTSELKPWVKLLFTSTFCKVIRSMCMTNVREVEFTLLQRWWKSLKLVRCAGYEIAFATNHLNKIVKAWFELQTNVAMAELEAQCDEISCKMKKLEDELEGHKRDLEVKKSKLHEYKLLGYRRSAPIKERLKYASEFKWKRAWDASPVMFR